MAELTKAESDLFKKAQTLTDKVKKNPEISADHKLETLQTIQSTTQKLIKKMYDANKVDPAETLVALDSPEVDVLGDAVGVKNGAEVKPKLIEEPDIELLMEDINPAMKQKLGGMIPDLEKVKSPPAPAQTAQPAQNNAANTQQAPVAAAPAATVAVTPVAATPAAGAVSTKQAAPEITPALVAQNDASSATSSLG